LRKIYLIGIGSGDPEHITVKAINALNAVSVIFVMDKGASKQSLMHLRKDICNRYINNSSYRVVPIEDSARDAAIEDYGERVEQWHEQRSLACEQIVKEELAEDQAGAFLVWGDPSLYDSTLRILKRIVSRGALQFEIEVIPGITSMQALAARHQIALNNIGESVVITTGRKLSPAALSGVDTAIVMLDGHCAFNHLSGEDWEIFWGAYVGMESEILLSGKLADVSEKIQAARADARRKQDWIMDIYMLRRLRSDV
jgi:precorrin-6A synthase